MWATIDAISKTIKPEEHIFDGAGQIKICYESTMIISQKSIIDASEYGNKKSTEFDKSRETKNKKLSISNEEEKVNMDENAIIMVKPGSYLGGDDDNSGRGGGIIWLESKNGDIINNGIIKSIGTNNNYSPGDVVIICKNGCFRNHGSIQCSKLVIVAKDVDINNKHGQIELEENDPKIYLDHAPKIDTVDDNALHFKYVSDFDKNGIVYSIATENGIKPWKNPAMSGDIRVQSSSLMHDSQPLSAIVGRDSVRCVTKPEKNSWDCH